KEMDFTPKQYKRQLARVTCRDRIGVVIPDIRNTYYAEVIQGIESVMDPKGIEVIICNTDEDPGKEIRYLNMLRQIQVGGIITVPVSDTVEYNAEFLIDMNNTGTPVVILDRDLRGGNMDGVFMNNYGGAYESIQAFIDNGHRDIAFICGPTTSTSGLDRLNGYLGAMKANGLPIHEEYILYGDFKFDLAYDMTKKLLEKQNRVTAIFSSNRRMSSGCMLALAEKDLVIGADMAFISCGKIDINFNRISHVSYPTVDIGEECAKILLGKMEKPKRIRSASKKRITFDMKLVLRGSEKFPPNRKRPD
ncbi:MAG: LacI family DNA-binding transcriptional regulator, partial [Anaerotruncus rubiinfantis]